MNMLVKISMAFIISSLPAGLFANCPLCEKIREQNKHLKNEFVYYEDYLKDRQGKERSVPENSNQNLDRIEKQD